MKQLDLKIPARQRRETHQRRKLGCRRAHARRAYALRIARPAYRPKAAARRPAPFAGVGPTASVAALGAAFARDSMFMSGAAAPLMINAAANPVHDAERAIHEALESSAPMSEPGFFAWATGKVRSFFGADR